MVGERRVGFFSVEPRAEELWLHSLFLLPEVQRTGLGRALLTETLATARQRGIPVRCQVMSFNPAVGFYERFGFTQYEAEEDCVYLQSSA
jgi:GNAT superfamily N-acetyltransferase